jgi:hypothetical protein
MMAETKEKSSNNIFSMQEDEFQGGVTVMEKYIDLNYHKNYQ